MTQTPEDLQKAREWLLRLMGDWTGRLGGPGPVMVTAEEAAALIAEVRRENNWKPEAETVEAEIAEFGHPLPGEGDHHEIRDWLIDVWRAAVKEEREACMRIVEGMARECRAQQRQPGIREPGSPVVVAAATLEDAARRLRERS